MTVPLHAISNNRANTFVNAVGKCEPFWPEHPGDRAVEGFYEEMWAQDVTAIAGYHAGASSAAGTLAPPVAADVEPARDAGRRWVPHGYGLRRAALDGATAATSHVGSRGGSGAGFGRGAISRRGGVSRRDGPGGDGADPSAAPGSRTRYGTHGRSSVAASSAAPADAAVAPAAATSGAAAAPPQLVWRIGTPRRWHAQICLG